MSAFIRRWSMSEKKAFTGFIFLQRNITKTVPGRFAWKKDKRTFMPKAIREIMCVALLLSDFSKKQAPQSRGFKIS